MFSCCNTFHKHQRKGIIKLLVASTVGGGGGGEGCCGRGVTTSYLSLDSLWTGIYLEYFEDNDFTVAGGSKISVEVAWPLIDRLFLYCWFVTETKVLIR